MTDAWDEMRRRGMEEEGISPLIRISIIAFGVVLVLALAFVFLTERVDATASCVVTSFGKEVGTAGPGLHLTTPDKTFNCYTIKQRTMELVEGDPAASNSQADYVDWAIPARTNDGIDSWAMLTMQYHIDPAAPESLYPTYADDEAVKEQLVKSRLRSVVPQALSLIGAETQYRGNIGPISDDIEKQLKALLDPFGIKVDYFELKRSRFVQTYEDAIKKRADEVEKAEQARLAQLTATNEAERKRIEADGDAVKKKTEADATAYQTVTLAQADADAESIRLHTRAQQLAAHPELIQWEQTQAIRDAGAVYLPSGTLPLFDIPQATPEPTE